MPGASVMMPAGGIPDDGDGHLFFAVSVQQIAQRFDFAFHLFSRIRELRHRAPVPEPPDSVEQQKPDCKNRDGPGERVAAHRTGCRRLGSTIKGALGTAPSARMVRDSSSTVAPRNFTTYDSSFAVVFMAARRASCFSWATVVLSSTCTGTCSQADVTITRTA